MSDPSTAQPGRTVGVLVDNLFYRYTTDIVTGILHAAESRDVRVLCFIGGLIKTSVNLGSRGNFLYDLVSKQNIEGLLILSGGFGNYCTAEELFDFAHRFASRMPVVSIGSHVADVPSILVDNDHGMNQLMHHVVGQHGRRRVAYIGGTEISHDAIARFNVYRKVLAECDIPFDPNLVYVGNFMSDSGRVGVETLLTRHAAFDALVVANDEMAVGAMKALQARGITVPDDIVVTGFDDSITARSVLPSLATVRQPTFEMGSVALERLITMLDGGSVADVELFPTRLIVRGSCGCYIKPKAENAHAHLRRTKGLAKKEQVVNDSAAQLHAIYADTVTPAVGSPTWAAELVTAMFDELDGYDGVFLACLQKLIARSIGRSVTVATWSEVIHDLFHLLPDLVRHRDRFSSLTNDTFSFLTHQLESALVFRQQRYEDQTLALYRANHDLLSTVNPARFKVLVHKMIDVLDLENCYLSLFDEGDKNSCHAVLSYQNDQLVPIPANDPVSHFSAQDLVPGGVSTLPAKSKLFVLPLFFEDEDLGFIVCDYNWDVSFPVYETMTGQLSTAVKTLRMVDKLVTHADNLEREVIRRIGDLQRKSVEVQRLNEELVRKSKLDSLTGLYNRKAFFEFLRRELNRARRQNERLRTAQAGMLEEKDASLFSILMIDLDHFKAVNDTHGHLAGDGVLQALGDLLRAKSIFRTEDICGRYGGEEFVALLGGTRAADALLPAERLMQELDKITFGDGSAYYKVTLSIGVAEYRLSDKDELEVIHRADQALYAAKQTGRNRIHVFDATTALSLTG